MTREFHWTYTKGCPCGDCKEYEREQEPAYKFQKMEDERAEFEATFKDLGYCMWRGQLKGDGPRDDYSAEETGHAWAGWLHGANVEWVTAP